LGRFFRLAVSPEPERRSRVAPRKGSCDSRSSKGRTRATGRDEWTQHHLGAKSGVGEYTARESESAQRMRRERARGERPLSCHAGRQRVRTRLGKSPAAQAEGVMSERRSKDLSSARRDDAKFGQARVVSLGPAPGDQSTRSVHRRFAACAGTEGDWKRSASL